MAKFALFDKIKNLSKPKDQQSALSVYSPAPLPHGNTSGAMYCSVPEDNTKMKLKEVFSLERRPKLITTLSTEH